MKSLLLVGVMVLGSTSAWAIITPPQSQEISLGLQSARRVVRTELSQKGPARALSWSQFMVTKHKLGTKQPKISPQTN